MSSLLQQRIKAEGGHPQGASLSAGVWTIRSVVEVDLVRRACACLTPEDEEQAGTRLPRSTPQDIEEESDSRKPGPLVWPGE